MIPPTVTEDWRLRIEVHEEGIAHELGERLAARELEHELDDSFAARLAVSRNGSELFVYSASRDQAEHAQQLIDSLAAQQDWRFDAQLQRWHEEAEDWQPVAVPLPRTDSERAAEHAKRIEHEREESVQRGYFEWEVRVDCASHDEARELADTLSGEGLPNTRRWRYLLVGAADEDSARALAERIRGLVPAEASVTVEGSQRAALDDMPHSPFAIF